MSSYSKNDSICLPVEEIVFIDSCNVSVPISYIRLTNEKLIERKYLIKLPNLKLLETMPNCKKVNIIQTYLISSPDEELRIRQRGNQGSYIYTLTKKKHFIFATRQETEKRISQREYLTLLNNADTSLHQVKKTRYCLMENNRYFEIDVYPNCNNTAICEIELSNESENIVFPSFIEPIKEVTNDKSYSNSALAKQFPCDLN